MFTLVGGTHPVYSLQVIGLLAADGMSFPFRDALCDYPELFRTKNPKYSYIGASPQGFFGVQLYDADDGTADAPLLYYI